MALASGPLDQREHGQSYSTYLTAANSQIPFSTDGSATGKAYQRMDHTSQHNAGSSTPSSFNVNVKMSKFSMCTDRCRLSGSADPASNTTICFHHTFEFLKFNPNVLTGQQVMAGWLCCQVLIMQFCTVYLSSAPPGAAAGIGVAPSPDQAVRY